MMTFKNMKTIGEILKKRREELGYSLRHMSEKTKVPLAKLNAIEEGDLKYFEDDLSYVKFYIRYYCNALLIDFDQFKDELDQSLEAHFNTTKMLQTKEINQLQNRVLEKSQRLRSPKKRQFDFSFLSFILSMTLLGVTLILVFIFLILPNVQLAPNLIVNEDPIPVPPVNEDSEEVVEDVDQTPRFLEVVKTQPLNYVIRGFDLDQELSLLVNFRSNAYVRITIDGESAINIPSKLYNVGSVLDFKFKAENNAVLEIYIGWMNGNTMYIDDIEIPIDSEYATRNGSVTFTFLMEGDQP